MKKVYYNYYSFTRLWCLVIWEINFVVKISTKQVNGFVYFSVHATLIEQRMKIKSKVDVKYSCKQRLIPVCNNEVLTLVL